MQFHTIILALKQHQTEYCSPKHQTSPCLPLLFNKEIRNPSMFKDYFLNNLRTHKESLFQVGSIIFPPLSRVWSTLPEKNGWTRERQTQSVTKIPN